MKNIIKQTVRHSDWLWLTRSKEFQQLEGLPAVLFALDRCVNEKTLSGQVMAKRMWKRVRDDNWNSKLIKGYAGIQLRVLTGGKPEPIPYSRKPKNKVKN
tara:strand:+ start:1231 stop:1530 length:300 start_codon:yes stop_codon:yes gene_type:complete